MYGLAGIAVAAVALMGQAIAAPVAKTVGPRADYTVMITKENTINGTKVENPTIESNPLTFSLINNFGGSAMYVYVDGKDVNNAPVMMTTSGSWYYPDPAGSEVPVALPADAGFAIPLGGQGSTTEFTIPDSISSGRVWVADGELTFFTVAGADGTVTIVEPSAVNPDDASYDINWGFVELTNTAEGGIYANISFVDFVGLVMSMRLTLGDGSQQTVSGLASTAVDDICTGMQDQAAIDGQPWDQMCQAPSGTPLRILAPNMYISTTPDAMSDYYTSYVDEVYTKYASEDLMVNAQGDYGEVACRATGDTLYCDGDSVGFAKPTTGDIMGCNSGPFANSGDDLHLRLVARLCAAFHRSELLLDGGNVTPSLDSSYYYTTDPTSHYARLVHESETDGKGYAFSYDDVAPEGENPAGVVAGAAPTLLEIFVGGQTF